MQKIASLIRPFEGQELDPHYLAYFDCFQRQLYFEAHEVLEPLWLSQRKEAAGAFYKGLIQLAGAFVHLQKHRPGPATALFKLAHQNLSQYQDGHQSLAVNQVLSAIEERLSRLQSLPNLAASDHQFQRMTEVSLRLVG